MPRPTVTLAIIVKNEERNLDKLFKSVENCFDEIIVVDTGSTDKTKSIAISYGAKVYDFQWVNDFSKARNFAFSKATCDYIAWIDADDVIDSKENFIQWRNYAMEHSDYWLAPYHYASDENGKPVCTFLRERVLKRSLNPQWNYFVHEGITLQPGWRHDVVHTWSVKHVRTQQDMVGDRGRNLKLLEANRGTPVVAPGLDARMQWYLGKEYFDNGKFDQALNVLVDVLVKDDLQLHDRILAMQFASYSAMNLAGQLKPEHAGDKLMLARQLAQQGLNLDPKRAEFYCLIGETYLAQNDVLAALPYYAGAENCITPEKMGARSMSPIFNFAHCYEELPKIQKAKIYMTIGKVDEAEKEALECVNLYPTDEAMALLAEIRKVKPIAQLEGPKTKTTDIVFSCPPHAAYPFDEDMYEKSPVGGSESALIQVSRLMKQITGRRVIVFNVRDHDLVAKSGVEWISNRKLNEYMGKYEPAVHISWRHNVKVTHAPTYLWCHDLVCPTVEMAHNFDKMLCLSEFHKNFVMARQGVPSDKIIVADNGLDPSKFNFVRKPKDPNKLVWMSSPDRGLDRAMLVCDRLIKKFPDIKLHVYNMFDNMIKYGLAHEARRLQAMMAERPYVIFHGFTEQSKMYHEVSDAVIWNHPCNFLETNCISAKEMLALGVFPVTRKLGGLQDTLRDAEKNGMAVMLDHDCVTDGEIQAYTNEIEKALEGKKWEQVKLDPNDVSWQKVAEHFVSFMGLKTSTEPVVFGADSDPDAIAQPTQIIQHTAREA